MKPRTLILLMVAVGCGLVAALLVSQLTAKQNVDKIDVPVAKVEMRPGTFIREPELMFEMKPFARELVPPTTITDVKLLRNKSLQRPLEAGSMVMNRDLGDSEGLGKSLPDGLRAQTIRVTVDSAVSGFILPGSSHVDLICMVPDTKDPKQIMAKTFLQNKLVLAVNAEDVKPEGARAMAAPSFVTLALTPDEVEKVARASRDGIPILSLRRPGDDKTVVTKGAVTPFGRTGTDSDGGVDTKEVYVAKKTIQAGTKITDVDEYFVAKKINADAVSPNAITEKTSIQGETVHRFLDEGQPLTRAYLVKESGPDKGETVVAIPKSHRMRIYNGANVSEHGFGMDTTNTTREQAPPPTIKDSGSEGK